MRPLDHELRERLSSRRKRRAGILIAGAGAQELERFEQRLGFLERRSVTGCNIASHVNRLDRAEACNFGQVKEIFGLYDTNDDYVFVADGGHWDNLGLVELLRRRCKVIVCIDASGDAAGKYTTLREAVAMATTEVDVWVDLGFLDGMNEETADLAATTVGVTTIRYPGGDDADGLLLFAKAQVAKDLPLTLRQFAAKDGTFPRYSTADQLLSDDQFRALVDLGKASGVRVLEMIAGIYYYRDLAAAAEA